MGMSHGNVALCRHRGTSLAQLRRLSCRRQCPDAPRSYEDYLFFDTLWSDPYPDDATDGIYDSRRGEGCILFGRDVTIDFLRRNSLQVRRDGL